MVEREEGHTPGPWLVREFDTLFQVHSPDGIKVVSTSWHGSLRGPYPLKAEARANARLAAAAPALLEAAIRLLEVNDRVADGVARATHAGDAYRLSVAGADEFTETLEPLRAAIALAHPEGER